MKNSIDISNQAQGAMAYTGVSITELAERSGIGRDNVRGYVNGKCKCRPEYISALADALDVTDEYLMGYTGFEPHLWRNRRSERLDCQDNTPNCIAIPHEVDPNVTAAQLIREKFPVEPMIRAYSVEVDGECREDTVEPYVGPMGCGYLMHGGDLDDPRKHFDHYYIYVDWIPSAGVRDTLEKYGVAAPDMVHYGSGHRTLIQLGRKIYGLMKESGMVKEPAGADAV